MDRDEASEDLMDPPEKMADGSEEKDSPEESEHSEEEDLPEESEHSVSPPANMNEIFPDEKIAKFGHDIIFIPGSSTDSAIDFFRTNFIGRDDEQTELLNMLLSRNDVHMLALRAEEGEIFSMCLFCVHNPDPRKNCPINIELVEILLAVDINEKEGHNFNAVLIHRLLRGFNDNKETLHPVWVVATNNTNGLTLLETRFGFHVLWLNEQDTSDVIQTGGYTMEMLDAFGRVKCDYWLMGLSTHFTTVESPVAILKNYYPSANKHVNLAINVNDAALPRLLDVFSNQLKRYGYSFLS